MLLPSRGWRDETRRDDPYGEVIDQPHLYGILSRINGLGLKLVSVQALPEDANPSAAGGARVPKEPKI